MKRRYLSTNVYIQYSNSAEIIRADNGDSISITLTEYNILEYFINHGNVAVSLESLAEHVWGNDENGDPKDPASLKPHITRIRKKLNRIDAGLGNIMQTLHGYQSYKFCVDKNIMLLNSVGQPNVSITSNNDYNIDMFIEALWNMDKDVAQLVDKVEVLVEKRKSMPQYIDNNDGYYQRLINQLDYSFYTIKNLYSKMKEICEKASIEKEKLGALDCRSKPRESDGCIVDCVDYGLFFESNDTIEMVPTALEFRGGKVKNYMTSSATFHEYCAEADEILENIKVACADVFRQEECFVSYKNAIEHVLR